MFKNKSLFKMLSAGVLLLGVVACEKGINDEIITPPAEIKFTAPVGTVGKYFITNSSSSSFKVPVGFTTISDKDRTINLTYTSSTGAVKGTHYNAPQSIVIPAGKAADSIIVAGIFANYPTGRVDTLRIGLSSPDAGKGFSDNTYTLVLQKYCDVSLTALAGNYTNTRESYTNGSSPYGPYTTQLKNLTSTGTNKAEGFIANIYNDGWNDIKVQLDWTDPANFKATIPLQATGKSYGGAATSVRTKTSATSSFSSCDRSITLIIELVNGSTVIDTDYRIIMK